MPGAQILKSSLILVIATCLVMVALGLSSTDGESAVIAAPSVPELLDPPIDRAVEKPPSEPLRVVELAPGQTLEAVSRDLFGEDWWTWQEAALEHLDARKLKPGQRFELFSGDRLQVSLDRRRSLVLTREAETFSAFIAEKPLERELVRLDATVSSSLFAAVAGSGEGPELAMELADVFRWDIDFIRDVREGDRLQALVEKHSVDGEVVGYGQIYAARYVNAGKAHDAVRFRGPDGDIGYYDLQGRPLEKMFLRSPLKLTPRVTSHFNPARLHPVTKTVRPHWGVDYGAPTGTPVHVTAAGVVTFVGRNGGAGNMVRVRHANGYESNYLHLSRYGKYRKGSRVSQGDVVGYVGSTGLSTAPHLDYRVKHNGKWLNPLRLASPPAAPLDSKTLKRFTPHADAVDPVLAGEPAPLGASC